MNKDDEITMWREWYLNMRFNTDFKTLHPSHKCVIRNYFLVLPTENFTSPDEEFNRSLNSIIDRLTSDMNKQNE